MKSAHIINLIVAAFVPAALSASSPSLTLANEPRGSLVIDFTKVSDGVALELVLQAAGIHPIMGDGSQPTLLSIRRDQGRYEHAMVNQSPEGDSRAVPLAFTVDGEVLRVALAAGNGVVATDRIHGVPATGWLIGRGSAGEVLATDRQSVDGLARTLLGVEAQRPLRTISLSYGSSPQAEAVSAIAVYRPDSRATLVPTVSAEGQRHKLRATWLDVDVDDDSTTFVALAQLKHTDGRNPTQVPFSFELRAVLELRDAASGASLSSLQTVVLVPQAAPFRDGPRGRIVQVPVRLTWDRRDQSGQVYQGFEVSQKLVVTAVRIGDAGQGDGSESEHLVDSMQIARRGTTGQMDGLRRVDGCLFAESLLEALTVASSLSEIQEVRTRLQENPEATAVLLSAALDDTRMFSERVRAIWLIAQTEDIVAAQMLEHLVDDSDPSVASASRYLVNETAGW